MSSFPLKSAWKYKIELINVFNEKFLKEKDIALQPIKFILDIDNNNININNSDYNKDELNSKTKSNNNISLKNSQKDEKEKKSGKSQKTSKSIKTKEKKNEPPKKMSLKNSGLYNSNIVIVQSITDGDSQGSCSDPIEKEVEKIKKMMTRSKSKKYKKKSSKSKIHKSSNSAKY